MLITATDVEMTIEEAREVVEVARSLADAEAALTTARRKLYPIFGVAAAMVEKTGK